MSKLTSSALAMSEVGLSWAGQYFPNLAAKVTGLDEPSDIILRWHLGRNVPTSQLLEVPGHPGATARNVRSWGGYLLATPVSMIEAMADIGRVPAMAHHIGERMLVGENLRRPVPRFLQPLPPELHEELAGRIPLGYSNEQLYATVTRVGEDPYLGAIGTIDPQNKRNYAPLPTLNLGHVATTPAGLYRV